MHDVDPKVLAKLIKQEKKGKLIWQKQDSRTYGKFEMVSNGKWTVIVEEITAPAVRMSLFGIFDKVIEPGEAIEMHYGEIRETEAGRVDYHPEMFMNAATLTRVAIGSTGLNPAAQFIYDNEYLTAINPEIAELTWSTIVYRSSHLGPRGPMWLGEHKEIMTYPIWPHHEENTWQSILQKFTGAYIEVAPAVEYELKKDATAPATEYPEIDDETYQQAVEWVKEQGAASVSAIQRHFRLGYSDSSRIIDRMEAEGIVGPFNPNGPRTVLARTAPLQ